MAEADSSTTSTTDDAAARIAALEARVAELQRERDEVVRGRDGLRAAYERRWLEVELMRRRIFIAKAERVDTTQLELEDKRSRFPEVASSSLPSIRSRAARRSN
jgi:transposase